ncbi:MAG TPA: antibiotic biosynthesis monooxygenase [bacterium]|nr:antibiotic biosynthesis monooxygenase [bacterium]
MALRPGEASAVTAAVTIVTQTRVRAGQDGAFARWQDHISTVVAGTPGFVTQTVIPPSPPAQLDWVILQRFTTAEAALAWLRSDQRQHLVEEAQPMLLGQDDIHLVADGESGVLPAPVSVVISTRVKPGQEDAFRAWERRIARAQAKSPGFQGYRFEPPIPGVQEDWVAILRFDSDANLRTWLNSPERRKLLEEADPFTAAVHLRTVRSGFDHWFPVGATGAARTPAWKQNMIVLLMLYPVVFLYGAWVDAPWVSGRAHLPFWLALFIGNAVSVTVLNWLVPWASRRFAWWLQPEGRHLRTATLAGTAVVVTLYGFCLLVFSRFR